MALAESGTGDDDIELAEAGEEGEEEERELFTSIETSRAKRRKQLEVQASFSYPGSCHHRRRRSP